MVRMYTYIPRENKNLLRKERKKIDMLGLITGAAGTVVNEQLDRAREDRTNKQTEKLMGIQQQNQRNLNQQGHDLSLKHWRDTSYPMQKMMMEKAGLNPALMYGNAGTGGSTGSGSGGGASMGQAASSQGKAMDINNSMLVKAQIDNIKADTAQKVENTGGIGETTRAKKFANDMNETIKRYIQIGREGEETSKAVKGDRDNIEWSTEKEMYKDKEGKLTNQAPAYKAIQAKMEIPIEQLKTAKANANSAEAEQVIQKFKSTMAQNGISPDTPWYAKLLTDLLEKAGYGEIIRSAIE